VAIEIERFLLLAIRRKLPSGTVFQILKELAVKHDTAKPGLIAMHLPSLAIR
jgi:hypothetical protein